MTKFLSLDEDAKCGFVPAVYEATQNQLMTKLIFITSGINVPLIITL